MYQERERIAGKEFQTAVQTKDRLKIPFGIMAVGSFNFTRSDVASMFEFTEYSIEYFHL